LFKFDFGGNPCDRKCFELEIFSIINKLGGITKKLLIKKSEFDVLLTYYTQSSLVVNKLFLQFPLFLQSVKACTKTLMMLFSKEFS
jgi:hypothetical protein